MSALPINTAILNRLRSVQVRQTVYSHKTKIDESHGLFEVDCSSYADYLLRQVAPVAFATLKTLTTHKRPLAEDYVSAIAQPSVNSGWQRIRRVDELEPGDLIAWLKPDDSTSTNTGHVMIVLAQPVPAGSHGFTVRVSDSSASSHDDDARETSGQSGIGSGTIYLSIDGIAAPTGYGWKGVHSKRVVATTVVLGRAIR